MSDTSWAIIRPLGWLLLLSLSYLIGVQLSGLARRLAAILHILMVFPFLASGPRVLALFPLSTLFVPLVHGFTLHAISILLSREPNLQVRTLPRLQRIRKIVLLETDLRGLQHNGKSTPTREGGEPGRLFFATKKTIHALGLWLLGYVVTKIVLVRVFQFLEISLDDFAPEKQSFLPSMEYHDLAIRSILSTQWIWSTYCLMTAAHDLCAVLFVSILGWDSAFDWPRLYGPLSNAFSLRRFWGSFWHKLHVTPFDAFMPSSLHRQKSDSAQVTTLKNMLRSLWVFAMSAACHARMNWALYRQNTFVAEVRFWMVNWAVCLLETILSRTMKDAWVDLRFRRQHWRLRRVLGYLFVWAFFMCTVPAWQYPLLYNYEA